MSQWKSYLNTKPIAEICMLLSLAGVTGLSYYHARRINAHAERLQRQEQELKEYAKKLAEYSNQLNEQQGHLNEQRGHLKSATDKLQETYNIMQDLQHQNQIVTIVETGRLRLLSNDTEDLRETALQKICEQEAAQLRKK